MSKRELYCLLVAYSYLINGELTEENKQIMKAYQIDSTEIYDYRDRIINYKDTEKGLNINQLAALEQMLGNQFNYGLLDYIRNSMENNENSNNTNSNTNSNVNTKAKVHTLTNGKKQFGNYDEAAFSDIYMFAFLVFLFQVLFLIISYIIFTK